MNKLYVPLLAVSLTLAGCSTPQRGSVPVVDAGSPLSAGGTAVREPQPSSVQSLPQDSGVVVMVPQGGTPAPIQAGTVPMGTPAITPGPISSDPTLAGSWGAAGTSAPSGIPSTSGLAADEQLDGPVLALLTTAQQQQSGGDLNGASVSLERAQRIAPREPQVLYRLAEVRLAQGDPAQAEQLARRGLTYANGRPALQASLWELIAQAREKQGDPAGAAQARQRAQVSS
ncbi:hypothetical protein CK486_12490 [Pseudomonas sp. HAR-UPW-AIA-41]|uniref:tetratricopeptide repeat protein n=1 Tax=Pseudomonas sp. HAR-UPW-AIA-41 TaxID=1985301 RepID=UPI000BB33361|nr:tetratricopeptide repeat protein [Pseudomonas sp. HAR-UPW-AIA-41]PAV47866.1 hypothetical protein CK486_12490 [Pseudomonas sp. HAR-UPW-AIA-41]